MLSTMHSGQILKSNQQSLQTRISFPQLEYVLNASFTENHANADDEQCCKDTMDNHFTTVILPQVGRTATGRCHCFRIGLPNISVGQSHHVADPHEDADGEQEEVHEFWRTAVHPDMYDQNGYQIRSCNKQVAVTLGPVDVTTWQQVALPVNGGSNSSC
jgi:hypothetical protein